MTIQMAVAALLGFMAGNWIGKAEMRTKTAMIVHTFATKYSQFIKENPTQDLESFIEKENAKIK